MKFSICILFCLIIITINNAQPEAGLLRFPSIHKNKVVFMKSGDLYIADINDGKAAKLTSGKGFEMFPRFSPNGEYIAFTGQYDGNTEVYIISVHGGTPKRLTYTAALDRDDVTDRMGPNNIVMCWTPDSKNIVYRSRRYSFNSFRGQLFKISVEGGLSEEIPLVDGGFCTWSPDGKQFAFNKIFREFRTWKYYQGGMADDIRIFNTATKETSRITDDPHQDIIPMWINEDIYFLSDRDRTMNLFCYNTKTKTTTKITEFTDYDIKFPSAGTEKIVFEKGGFLFIYNVKSQETKKLTITITGDNLSARNEIKSVIQHLQSYDISPDGNRLILSARGEIFSVAGDKGVTYNFTRSSGANDRDVTWSPDGKHIAFISDKSGEFELYIQKSDGSAQAEQLTNNADTYYYSMKWSPDSKKLLWSDRKFRLRYIDIETKKITEVQQSKIWELRDFNWSPDSKWIVFSEPIPGTYLNQVKVYNLDSEETTNITQGWYEANSPVFSEDGKYLIFASARDFRPIYSNTEWNIAYQDLERIYLVLLQEDTPSPFAPKNDAVKIEKNEEKGEKDKKKSEGDKKDTGPEVKIDLQNIEKRIVSIPVSPAGYGDFYCDGSKLYYRYRKNSTGEKGMKFYDLKEQKETDLLDNATFIVSANKKKMLIKKGHKFSIIDLPSSKIKPNGQVDLSELTIYVDLKQEWTQIFNEAWRQMRDFFYVENMHGVDWAAMKDKYAALLPYVQHRADLTYIIGEMIGELNIGHAYTGGGDFEKAKRIKTGLLGAQFSKDKSGYFKVEEILKGENWDKKRKSPLDDVDVDVNTGDYIIAINGVPAKAYNNIFEPLVGLVGQEIELTVNTKPEEKNAKKVLVVPVADESELYYYKWLQDNINKVSKATNGQVGYIHVRDMGNTGLNDFMTHFYPQLNKKALIIDDRGNGGGNVSPMLIERLRREITRSRMLRNAEIPYHVPQEMLLGPKVLLMDEYSASDGDLFPYSFKKHKLGKTIGKRTWGGVVGIRGPIPFVDGGVLYKPEFASYHGEKSEWIIEGHGVDPDIVVENDPYKQYMGEDKQLEKAIEVILEELKEYKGLPDIPEPPDKSK